ncbi:MAG: ATP-binding protein [Chlamydiae bacterium]|nr:ATP-binding protein [Chlamydiota bacterium]MBI3276902.1 ATP-binding protein [Chlamydiota bacterium]
MLHRSLKIDLPKGQSAFLWGPRKTGKTTLIQSLFPKSIAYNLLETDTYLRLSKEPFRLREELAEIRTVSSNEQPIILDEVQKIPQLLDEVHNLIEQKGLSFFLCGSSARKLKKGHANMLGGRAWRYELYPLTSHELGKEFDLMKALNRGLIPSHYLSDYYAKSIKTYIQDYLKEEIQSEGLVRNLPAFARFLDTVPFNNGELVNFSNIARECSVDSKTVAAYYQILVDTLMGYFIEPFRKVKNRQIIGATPKFYLFDVGVAGGMSQRTLSINKGDEFGKAFEHFILMELIAYRAYSERDFHISFWRTKDGLEVDFVLNHGEVALEVKGISHVGTSDLKGLSAFREEHHPKHSILICQEPKPRKLENGITILPWKIFLERLWNGDF